MVSIKEFFELREAGYSVEQIKEYSSFIEQPEQKPKQKPEQKPEQKPFSISGKLFLRCLSSQ